MMLPLQCVVLLICAVTHEVAAETGYVDYYPGTLNVILAASHGGNVKPLNIPDRDFGCYVEKKCVWTHGCGDKDTKRCRASTSTDLYTRQMALALREALHKRSGQYPHLVISQLKRTKLDPNRERNQATFNESVPAMAWDEFHGFLEEAKVKVSARGPGLLVDVHGHGRKEQWAMLGFLVTRTRLNNNMLDVNKTSIKAGDEQQVFEDILRGPESFGAYLAAEGFDAVPSPVNPGPGASTFYSGGYITVRHGSRDGGIIDAIQIESPSSFRKERFDEYVEALATTIHKYVGRYYPDPAEDPNRMSGTSMFRAHWCLVPMVAFGLYNLT